MKKFFCNGKKGFCDTYLCNNCDFADGSCGEYKEVPVTNADRIRAMSDEELAEFLTDLACDGNLRIREWLNHPAEEE